MNVIIGLWQIMVKLSDSLDIYKLPFTNNFPFAHWLVDNMIVIDMAHFSKMPANFTASMAMQLKDNFLKLLVNCFKYANT